MATTAEILRSISIAQGGGVPPAAGALQSPSALAGSSFGGTVPGAQPFRGGLGGTTPTTPSLAQPTAQPAIGGAMGSQQIQQAFQDILGRQADAPGLEFFLGDLRGGQSIEDIRRSISTSAEAQAIAQQQASESLLASQRASAGAPQIGLPQPGLAGAEVALAQGQQTQLDPFLQAGQQAGDLQAALAGVLGPEAQQQALAQFQQPVNTFLQEQGEQAITRNAAALGGLGGGNVQKELVRFGQGLAGQSAQQQFQNLGAIANRGFGAAQAGFGGAQQLANLRQQTGIEQARLESGTTSALANLINQQGGGISDIVGGSASNLANLLSGAGQQFAGSNEQLAALLANLAVQEGSQVAGQTGLGQFTPTGSTQNTANILGALGTLGTTIGGGA